MKKRLQELKDKAGALLANMRGILDGAAKENRATTEEENAKYDAK